MQTVLCTCCTVTDAATFSSGSPMVTMRVAVSLPAGEQLLSLGTQREGDTVPYPPNKEFPSTGVRRQLRNLLGP